VPNTLLHNDRDGTFTDVTDRARVGHPGWDLAAAWADYDDDGWPDLYVANEFGGNALYRNNGDGTFSERAAAAGVVDGGASMGVAWGDYDGDGRLDLFVSNMHANSGWALFHPDFPAPVPRLLQLIGLFTPEVGRRTELIVDHLVRGSSLYHNNGDGTFTYVNDADRVEDGRGLSVFDYDGDGQQDLLMRNYRQPAELLRNLGGGGHWIEIALLGVRSNRDAVGARVAVRTGRGWQTREVSAG